MQKFAHTVNIETVLCVGMEDLSWEVEDIIIIISSSSSSSRRWCREGVALAWTK